jgi:AcrR family transcriptional regulator
MPRSGLDRQAVIDEAANLVDHEGLDALALATLARRLGIRSPSLYSHVDSLDDLRGELRLRGLRTIAAEMRRRATGVAGDEAVGAVCRAIRAVARAHPGLYAATVPADTADGEEVAAAAGDVLDVAVTVLRGAGVAEDDLIDAARFVRSAAHGFISLEASGGFGLPVDLDRSFDRLVAAVNLGLGEFRRDQ